jgi:peptidoglycan L-alanyl-D-glutamate endopeptidase CwlK
VNKTSLKKLATCHQDLQLLAHAVDKVYPIQVICGERGKEDQEKAFEGGKSKLEFPNSKHNINHEKGRFKSHAMDIVPDPDRNPGTLDWGDTDAFETMLLTVEQVADDLDIKIGLGRDFKIRDYPHVELVN